VPLWPGTVYKAYSSIHEDFLGCTASGPMPLRLMVAVNARGSEMGLQSRWYRQHRSPPAPDPPEPNETRVPPRSSAVEVQFHLVRRRADPGLTLHDELKRHRVPDPLVPVRLDHLAVVAVLIAVEVPEFGRRALRGYAARRRDRDIYCAFPWRAYCSDAGV